MQVIERHDDIFDITHNDNEFGAGFMVVEESLKEAGIEVRFKMERSW